MKTKSIGIVVIFVLVFGFAGYALGFFGKHETPTQMLAGAIASDQNIDKTVAVTLDLKKKKTVSDATYSDLGKFTLTAAEKANKDDTASSSLKMSFDGYALMDDSGSPFSKIDVAGDLLVANKIFYVRATKLPMIPFFDPAAVKDKWWSLDLVSMAREFGGEDKAKEVQTYLDKAFAQKPDDTKAMDDIFEKDNFIVNPQFTKTESINGHTVKDISFTVDKKILANFVNDVSVYGSKKDGKDVSDADVQTLKDATQKFMDSVTFAPVLIGISSDDHHVYTVSSSIEVTDPTYDPSDASAFQVAHIDFSATYDYTTPVTIDIPTDSQPIEKLISSIFGAGMTAQAGNSLMTQ